MGLALICPGQGSQHAQLFAALADESHARPALDAVADALAAPRGDIVPALSAHIPLAANRVAQVLVTGAALAYWDALRDSLPEPVVVLGYSVGELAAHSIAGTFSARGAITLAQERARLMDACVTEPQAMLALPACPEAMARSLAADFGLAIAIRNGPGHVVLGGLRARVEEAAAWLDARQMQVRRLDVAVASHTPLMQGAVEPLRQAIAGLNPKRPARAVLAGIDGSLIRTAEQAIDTLARQIAEPLEWQRCLALARERGATAFLEIGPGRALAKMAGERFPDMPARSVEDFQSIPGIAKWAWRVCGE